VPNLTIREGMKERLYKVERDVISIGRAATNTIVIQDAKSSKEHCRIERSGDRWKLVDLESKNGTQVNGEFCNKAWLEHGDTIQIGELTIRFGVEARRRVVRKSPVAARGRGRRDAEVYDEEEGERRPVRRRYGRSPTDWAILIGSVLAGGALIIFLVIKVGGSMQKDTHNETVLRYANRLMEQDKWQEALNYLQKHGDPEGNAYVKVKMRIDDLAARKDAFYAGRAQQLATQIVSKLTRRIRAYDAGVESARPEDILKLVERLKTEFADTEATKQVREMYRAWFAGKVPQRASDFLASGSKLRKDWEETLARAAEYEKDWRFREARETVVRFLTSREAILEAADLEEYRRLRDERLRGIDLKAQGIYYAQERRAGDLAKSKRYDQAIRLYQKVIDNFGIDLYVRKAATEIRKLEAAKASDR
jgi:hypothetical protein